MRCVRVVATYQAAPTRAKVTRATASLSIAWDLPPAGTAPSIRAVGECLERGIGRDHPHVLVGHVFRGRLDVLYRSHALQELGDLGHPLVSLGGALRAIHDLEVLL